MSLDLQNTPEVQVVADGNSLFSVSLYHELKKQNTGNLILSALSLSVVTALVKLGARGETAEEIANVFHFPYSNEILGNGYSQVLSSLRQLTDGYTLLQANKLYCGTGFKLKENYTTAVNKYFDAGIEQIDFSNKIAAANTINEWVQDLTNNKITDILDPDLIDGLTRMVLVNGIYFQGLWKSPFPVNQTEKSEFFLEYQGAKEVDMMHALDFFQYIEIDYLDTHIVALPYKGDRMSMIIYLPKKNSGLAKLELGMADLIPSIILPQMDNSSLIDIYLPRFRIESTLPLKEALQNLGVNQAFKDTADLSGITLEGIYISDVLQKAFIDVNEEGTESAAATSVVTIVRGNAPRVIEFKADHPFLFQIVDSYTNAVIFSGCVQNP